MTTRIPSYDDHQIGAVLSQCVRPTCRRWFYMTVLRPVCLACQWPTPEPVYQADVSGHQITGP